MSNLLIAGVIFIFLIWIAYLYTKSKNRPDKFHCGYISDNYGSVFDKFIFSIVDIFLFIPRYIINLFRKKMSVEFSHEPAHDDKIKVAFIGNYGTACGIATYNQALINELKYHVDIKVFAEYADEERSTRLPDDPSWIIRCWSRHDHPKTDLIDCVNSWNPNVVHFSHEYGIWHKAYYFTQIISTFKQRGYKVISTMHSVYEHIDKLVSESSVPNLVVHTEQAKVTLVKKGIEEDRIHVIPHGSKFYKGTSDSPELLEPLWNTWQSEHTIYQPGFLFGYKGHLRMLNVVAALKNKYPDVHYIIQGSENKLNMEEHDELYNKIIDQSKFLGITENVTVNRGFVSEEVLMSAIRTVKICVLPYNNHPEHDVRASSGAARTILPTSTPMVVSGVHLFDDLEGVVPRARDEFELFTTIDDIFSNYHSNVQSQLSKRLNFIRKTSWESIAYRTSVLYNSLLED